MSQPLNDWAKGCPKSEPSAGKGTHESMQISQGFSNINLHGKAVLKQKTPGRTNVSSTTWTKWLYILYRPASKYNTDWFCIVDTALLTLILLKGSAALWIGSVFLNNSDKNTNCQCTFWPSSLFSSPALDQASTVLTIRGDQSILTWTVSWVSWKIPLEVVDSLLMYLLWKTTIKHKS